MVYNIRGCFTFERRGIVTDLAAAADNILALVNDCSLMWRLGFSPSAHNSLRTVLLYSSRASTFFVEEASTTRTVDL